MKQRFYKKTDFGFEVYEKEGERYIQVQFTYGSSPVHEARAQERGYLPLPNGVETVKMEEEDEEEEN